MLVKEQQYTSESGLRPWFRSKQ